VPAIIVQVWSFMLRIEALSLSSMDQLGADGQLHHRVAWRRPFFSKVHPHISGSDTELLLGWKVICSKLSRKGNNK
jgi:hypothetical protein